MADMIFDLFAELMKRRPTDDTVLDMVRQLNPERKNVFRYIGTNAEKQRIDQIKEEADVTKKPFFDYYMSAPFIQLFLEFGLFKSYDHAITHWESISENTIFHAFGSFFKNKLQTTDFPEYSSKTIKRILKHVLNVNVPRLNAHFMYREEDPFSQENFNTYHIFEFGAFNGAIDGSPLYFDKIVRFVKAHDIISIEKIEAALMRPNLKPKYVKHVQYLIILYHYDDLLKNKTIAKYALECMNRQRDVADYDAYSKIEKHLLNEIHFMNKTDMKNLKKSMPKSVFEGISSNADIANEIASYLMPKNKENVYSSPVSLNEEEMRIITSKHGKHFRSSQRTMKSLVPKKTGVKKTRSRSRSSSK